MTRILRGSALPLAAATLLTLSASVGSAQFVVAPVVTSCYTPAPVFYAPPAPTVSFYAPAPVVSHYAAPAPTVAFYAPAPVVQQFVPAPVAFTTTHRYGLFGRRTVTHTGFYYP